MTCTKAMSDKQLGMFKEMKESVPGVQRPRQRMAGAETRGARTHNFVGHDKGLRFFSKGRNPLSFKQGTDMI